MFLNYDLVCKGGFITDLPRLRGQLSWNLEEAVLGIEGIVLFEWIWQEGTLQFHAGCGRLEKSIVSWRRCYDSR